MMLSLNKNYRLKLSKENFIQILRDKWRSPAERADQTFMDKKCGWVTGKIDYRSFSLSDYRFNNTGISFIGNFFEINDETEVKIKTKFSLTFFLLQIFFTIIPLYGIFLNVNIYLSLFLLLLWISGTIRSCYYVNSTVNSFYRFFESLFIQKGIFIK